METTKHGILLVITLTLGAACVPKSASTGATDTGEELRFRAHNKKVKVKEREVVGSTDHYNSGGDYVGSSDQTRIVEKTKVGPRVVRFYQGTKRIGESDFYRFGRDLDGAKLAEAKQSKFWWMNVGGIGLATVGAGSMVAAGLGTYGEGAGTTLGYIGSGLVTSAGTFLIYYTLLNRDNARLPLERAGDVGVRF